MISRRPAASRRAFLASAASLSAIGAAGCLTSGTPEELSMGVVPDVDPDTAIQRNASLTEYLEGELDVRIDLTTAADYAGMVRAMAAGQVDVAYYGGVSYVMAHRRADARPLVVGEEDGSTQWHSAFVVHESADLTSMEDVRREAADLELVFGDPISTSGTVMPTYYLRTEYDRDPETDFASVTHVGAHDATAETIAGGNGDVGALNARIYDALRADDRLDGATTELWRSPGFPDYPWTVAPSVDDDRATALREAFTALDDEGRTDVLERQNVDRYVPVSHETFADLSRAVEMAGILEEFPDE